MDKGKFSKQDYIEYMLDNADLEKAMCQWNSSKKRFNDMIMIIKIILKNYTENRGLIVSVNDDTMQTGADNIQFCDDERKRILNTVVDKRERVYMLGFTSRERFQAYCNDTSGIVMFLDDIFGVIDLKGDVDGIIINFGNEEVFLEKDFIRSVIQLVNEE